MDTLEERNLNRLRRGKMMLAFAKEKNSYGLAVILTVFAGWLGAHRFYLDHKLIGIGFLACSAFIVLGFFVSGDDLSNPIMRLVGIIVNILMTVVVVEIILSFWVVGRENDRIKARLSAEYDVKELHVFS